MKPRDFQKAKVYAAENQAFHGMSRHIETIPEINAWLIQITNEKWFKERFKVSRKLILADGRGTRKARGGVRGDCYWLNLPKWARKDWIVLHELAHNLQPRPSPGHGIEFCEIYLWLVKRVLGKKAGDALTTSFLKHGVKFHSGQRENANVEVINENRT